MRSSGVSSLSALRVSTPAARECWDVAQRKGRDGQSYTTLRHSTLGISVELWHESRGGFHVYAPPLSEEGKGSVYCCFSSGIAVLEDRLCAPEILLELCTESGAWGKDGLWEQNPDYEIPEDGLLIKNSEGSRAWIIQPDGESIVLGGQKAMNSILISHAGTDSEIILHRKGIFFVGADSLELPGGDDPCGDLLYDNNLYGTDDPIMVRLQQTVKGMRWETQWRMDREAQEQRYRSGRGLAPRNFDHGPGARDRFKTSGREASGYKEVRTSLDAWHERHVDAERGLHFTYAGRGVQFAEWEGNNWGNGQQVEYGTARSNMQRSSWSGSFYEFGEYSGDVDLSRPHDGRAHLLSKGKGPKRHLHTGQVLATRDADRTPEKQRDVLFIWENVGVAWISVAEVEEELQKTAGNVTKIGNRELRNANVSISDIKPGMAVKINDSVVVYATIIFIKGTNCHVEVREDLEGGQNSREGQEREDLRRDYKSHQIMEVQIDGQWCPMVLAVPSLGYSLISEKGRDLLQSSEFAETSVYSSLRKWWSKQTRSTSCGVCCSVMAINYLLGMWQYSEQDVIRRVADLIPFLNQRIFNRHGLTLSQVTKLCQALLNDTHCSGISTQYSHSQGHSIDDLRKACMDCLNPDSKSCVIANFYMGEPHNQGIGLPFEMGHFSPIGAYDAESDSILIMDVWWQSADAYWVKTEDLWQAMCKGPGEKNGSGQRAKKSRGFIVVSLESENE